MSIIAYEGQIQESIFKIVKATRLSVKEVVKMVVDGAPYGFAEVRTTIRSLMDRGLLRLDADWKLMVVSSQPRPMPTGIPGPGVSYSNQPSRQDRPSDRAAIKYLTRALEMYDLDEFGGDDPVVDFEDLRKVLQYVKRLEENQR
jgi:hypothetical protein